MQRLILFAKRPRDGAVKTRLVPPLTEREALSLYESFLEDQLRFVRSTAAPGRVVELSTDEPWTPERALADAAAGMVVSEQGPGDLGARMLNAFARSHAAGARATVIVGADCPDLPRDRVEQAFERLGSATAVVVPAADGGYVLIGLARPVPELFDGVPWGGSRVMERTRRRAAEARIDLAELDSWYDVDDMGGLERLRRSLATIEGRRRAPATARCLAGLDSPSG